MHLVISASSRDEPVFCLFTLTVNKAGGGIQENIEFTERALLEFFKNLIVHCEMKWINL